MHVQPQFEESRPVILHGLIQNHSLATFIIVQDGEIVVNHMPLLVSVDEGEFGVLRGHLPIGNSLWQSFDGASKAVAVFHGPSSYITPSWYPSKHQHGKAVPTWNYVVVHAHGLPVAVRDPAWLLEHLNELTNKQELSQQLPWKVSDAPEDYTEKMLRGIVGIEMPITLLEGKWKVSQNRPEADRIGVAAGLRNQGDENALAMESLVCQTGDNSGE